MQGGGGGSNAGGRGAKVLGKLPVPGHPTNLDYSRARAYCACSRCGWGLVGHFSSHLSLLFCFSLSLWEMARYRLIYCLKGQLSPKQPINQLKCKNSSPASICNCSALCFVFFVFFFACWLLIVYCMITYFSSYTWKFPNTSYIPTI